MATATAPMEVDAVVREYIDAHRNEINAGIKAALGQLNGTESAAVSLMTGRSAEELDDLGGLPKQFDDTRRAVAIVPGTQAFPRFHTADARRLADQKPKGTWPPKFVGMIKDGPVGGSTAVDHGGVCLTAW